VCDHIGGFMLVGTTYMNGRCYIIERETIDLLDAMKEVEQHDFNNVVFLFLRRTTSYFNMTLKMY
jgi:hypothetical protein